MHIDSNALALSLPRRITQADGQGRGQGGAPDGWQDGYEDAPSEAEGAALDGDETRGSLGIGGARAAHGRATVDGGPSFLDTLIAHIAPGASAADPAFDPIAACGTAAGPAWSTLEFAALAAAPVQARRPRGAYRPAEGEAVSAVRVDVAV